MNKPLVLVVEDDRPIRNLIVTTLKAHDYHYLTAENGHSAIIEATSHNPDIVLLDLGQQLGKRYCFSAGVYGDPAQKAGAAKGLSAIHSDAYRRRLPYAAGRLRKARKQGFEPTCNRKSFRN